jgi:hypothetical protein
MSPKIFTVAPDTMELARVCGSGSGLWSKANCQSLCFSSLLPAAPTPMVWALSTQIFGEGQRIEFGVVGFGGWVASIRHARTLLAEAANGLMYKGGGRRSHYLMTILIWRGRGPQGSLTAATKRRTASIGATNKENRYR